MVAKGAKFLDYGFGPASGSKLVIEELGEVSEVEEDYEEYQNDRVGKAGSREEGKGFWHWKDEEAK